LSTNVRHEIPAAAGRFGATSDLTSNRIFGSVVSRRIKFAQLVDQRAKSGAIFRTSTKKYIGYCYSTETGKSRVFPTEDTNLF